MPPDPDRSLVDSLTDPSRPGVPRVWETAVALRDDSGLPLIRSASSRHHRTAEQEVGQTYTSQIALSKLFDLPEGLTEAGVLVSSGFLDLNLTDPVSVSPDDRVLLHACVIVTVGAARATLVDTQRNQLYLAPLRLGQILEHHRGATGSEILDREPDVREADLYRWLGCLLATDLATTIDEPAENFPVIALGPDQVRDIESAVVDIDADSDFDLAGLVEELDGLGCEHIELRYIDETNPDVLAADLAETDGSRLRSVQVIAPWTPDWTTEVIEQLCIDYARLARLTLHGAPEAATLGDERYQAALVARRLDGHDGCGQIHPLYFGLNLDSVIRSAWATPAWPARWGSTHAVSSGTARATRSPEAGSVRTDSPTWSRPTASQSPVR